MTNLACINHQPTTDVGVILQELQRLLLASDTTAHQRQQVRVTCGAVVDTAVMLCDLTRSDLCSDCPKFA